MKVLIFSMSDKAVKLAEDLRADGQTAALRNPQFFSSHPSQFEGADKVFCESDEIEAIYKDRDIEVERLDKAKRVSSVKATTRTTKKTKATKKAKD